MTTLKTKMIIGYKMELAMNNGIKIIAAKGRQIVVTLEKDMYNVYAFTLKGVKIVNEKRINSVFGGEQLQEAIIEAAI